jgi:hypothetical protein
MGDPLPLPSLASHFPWSSGVQQHCHLDDSAYLSKEGVGDRWLGRGKEWQREWPLSPVTRMCVSCGPVGTVEGRQVLPISLVTCPRWLTATRRPWSQEATCRSWRWQLGPIALIRGICSGGVPRILGSSLWNLRRPLGKARREARKVGLGICSCTQALEEKEVQETQVVEGWDRPQPYPDSRPA